MAGLTVTRSDLDLEVGNACRNVNLAMKKMAELFDGLKSRTDQELLDLGYDQADVDAIRGALKDGDDLNKVYRGGQAQATPYDFRKDMKELWGLGV